MASHAKILNLTSGFNYKRGQIERAMKNFAVEWVVPGVSVRSLNLQESRDARAKQVALNEYLSEPLPNKEHHGLRFEPSTLGIGATRRENYLVWQAHDYSEFGVPGSFCELPGDWMQAA